VTGPLDGDSFGGLFRYLDELLDKSSGRFRRFGSNRVTLTDDPAKRTDSDRGWRLGEPRRNSRRSVLVATHRHQPRC
jgi:hypothetical protein